MKYLVTNQGPNRAQRRAADKQAVNRSEFRKQPSRMQRRVEARSQLLFLGRYKLNSLFLRAGIALNL